MSAPPPTRTLLVDNYDSFTYNLYSLLSRVNGIPPVVVTHDTEWDELGLERFDNIVVSPGPGRPDRARDFGISDRILADAGLPVLGVCLGHQGLCHLYGSPVVPAPEPVHGRIARIVHDGTGLFSGLPSPFDAVRYHSLIAARVPDELVATAYTDDGLLMAVAHRQRPLWGVQFHPESICTDYGAELLGNFRAATPARAPITVTGPPPAADPRLPQFVLDTRVLDFHPDPHAVYETLFADGPHSFWLDGSVTTEPGTRFTVMGDSSGPRAEFVTYSVAETTVREYRAGAPVAEYHRTFFDHLDERLTERRVARRDDLPFAFALGYVGYLGYELKADAGGQLVHTSTIADASMVFADRAVVLDHEAGRCYLLALSDRADDPETVAWFDSTAAALATLADTDVAAPTPVPLLRDEHDPQIRLRHTPARYLDMIEQCQAEIRSGETYEVCLTNTATVDRRIDPLRAYRTLREISPTPYSALLHFPEVSVLSASPERFLRIGADGTVESKPIKGTRPRGGTVAEDTALRDSLRTSEKDRSENLMIVDLVRNDLSRVCEPGSVHVPRLFDVETYSAVHQLVSTVRGTLRPDVTAVDCVRAAFPGGSMTGAPKLRTMEIIDKLEDGPRGVYSGAIGYLSPTGTADLSIVIRTMVATDHQVTFGIGGAIVALSDPDDELEETLVKSLVMQRCLTETETTPLDGNSAVRARPDGGAGP
ncbi:aminodeoxychorismate synthase component I [Rhodococcus coprophilus]|uniref:aminodeoxychorismate synthase n=1 Tax=Rhodococcus coprophilus TaxID=38310 RepID=A0A2X4U0U2_9NOCA|nr:aminodeoxychorismate synthase component I [Rhodococcus coprophilus]MBM7460853.1 para-aminobenzoate synthetase [Rhodococcus coprophilus]SQI28658.1 anthranilate synthase [Rhodococcus coprophilus]